MSNVFWDIVSPLTCVRVPLPPRANDVDLPFAEVEFRVRVIRKAERNFLALLAFKTAELVLTCEHRAYSRGLSSAVAKAGAFSSDQVMRTFEI